MIKVLVLTMLLVKGFFFKMHFLDIDLTTSFGVRNFGNT